MRNDAATATEGAESRQVPKLGDLRAHAPIAGTIVNPCEGWHCPAHSYNPRRFADSRRKWARDRMALFSRVPQVGFLTTTLPAALHGEITRESLEYESAAWRAFKQRCDRRLRSIVSPAGRCDLCIAMPRSCVRRYKGQLVGRHSGKRFYPAGRCAQCSHWRRLEWWASRHVWACSRCLAKPRLSPRLRDAAPCFRASWVREVGENLEHLHRHAKVTMPYVPQGVLADMAESAGLGRVLDIRVDRDSAHPEARGALDSYLVKQSAIATPEHPALARYFTKQAADPDAFNALPIGAARSRINFPVERERANPCTIFTRFDEITVRKLFFETGSERNIDNKYYLLPDRYLRSVMGAFGELPARRDPLSLGPQSVTDGAFPFGITAPLEPPGG
jgi:hypothetical protein